MCSTEEPRDTLNTPPDHQGLQTETPTAEIHETIPLLVNMTIRDTKLVVAYLNGGLSLRDTAEPFGVSHTTVRRALRKLARGLQKQLPAQGKALGNNCKKFNS